MSENLVLAGTVSPKLLAVVAGVGTASATAYTVPTSTSCIIRKGLVANTGSSTVNFSLRISKSGSNVATMYPATPILPGDTMDLTEIAGLPLGPSDSIIIFASSASVLNFVLAGIESA